MRRLLSDMNPTLRGFLIIALVALVIVILSLEETLFALSLLLQIAFFLAVAFFIYLIWRERRGDIAMWSRRAQVVFYGAALLIVANLGAAFYRGGGSLFGGLSGFDAIAFLVVFALAGFSMWRVWRDEHTYG